MGLSTQPPIPTSAAGDLHSLGQVQKEFLRIKISLPEILTQLVWCGPKKWYFKKIPLCDSHVKPALQIHSTLEQQCLIELLTMMEMFYVFFAQ